MSFCSEKLKEKCRNPKFCYSCNRIRDKVEVDKYHVCEDCHKDSKGIPRRLPIVTLLNGKTYFLDERLKEIRNTANPFDTRKLINIEEFLQLPNRKKEKYQHLIKIGDREFEDYTLDVGIFDNYDFIDEKGINRGLNFICDECERRPSKVIGTGDSREPKFCFNCFEEININSLFVIQ